LLARERPPAGELLLFGEDGAETIVKRSLCKVNFMILDAI
jgi:hypothetical protein